MGGSGDCVVVVGFAVVEAAGGKIRQLVIALRLGHVYRRL